MPSTDIKSIKVGRFKGISPQSYPLTQASSPCTHLPVSIYKVKQEGTVVATSSQLAALPESADQADNSLGSVVQGWQMRAKNLFSGQMGF